MDLINLESSGYNYLVEGNNNYLETGDPLSDRITTLPSVDLAIDRIADFYTSENFAAEMEVAFGVKGSSSAAELAVTELISGNRQPDIEFYNGQDLGANGVYVAESNTIYLATDLLTGQPETAARVIVEELGHYLDTQIDSKDAVGDEGQIFAAGVFGDNLSDRELSVLKADNDSGIRFIDGEFVSVEQASVHLRYGNPSGGSNFTFSDYFLDKSQYALSYNGNKGGANWVSWQLNNSWLGSTRRQNDFREDPSLPSNFYRVDGNDYRGSGYDRGHIVASADRTRSRTDNSATFFMTNMIPQAPDNNQGPWREFEEFTRNLARQGKDLYIVSGGEGSLGTIANGNVTVPEYTWKTVLILDRPGATVTQNSETIAIRMPNTNGIRNRDWRDYLVSVDTIESRTGFDFYSLIPDSIENQIESRVYGSSNTGGFPSGGGSSTNTGGFPSVSTSSLSIRSLLPNPSGDENFNEQAEIINQGSTSVDLTGWKLRDAANTTWSLDGIVGANQSLNIRRNNQRMALNNSGDTIQLIDPFGNVVDTVSYQNALTDLRIFF